MSRVEAGDVAVLDADYESSIRAARSRVDTDTRDARDALTGAAVGALVLAVIAAVAIVIGLRRRIQEFS